MASGYMAALLEHLPKADLVLDWHNAIIPCLIPPLPTSHDLSLQFSHVQ